MALFKSRFTKSQIEEAINRALNVIIEGKTYINRGAWQSGGSYSNTEESIDYVIYNGMSYFCLVTHSGQTDPPDEDTTNWAPLYAYEPFLKNAPEDEIDDSDFLIFVDSSDDERTKKISWADIKEMLPIDIDQPIEMRATDTYIQWRYVGTADWTNLIAISEITGPQGPKGDTGEKGAKGDPGPGLEFDWNGTQLGVRVEGQEDYVYVNLKGEKGDTGIGIASVDLVSGNHAAGTFDTYRITLTDNTTYDFQVYNGADGEGVGDMLKAVYDTDSDGKVDAAEVADYADEAGHAETAYSATTAGYATTAGSANSVSWSNVQNRPSTYAPSAHANSHKTGGSDALSAADIGAVPTSRKINNKELTSDITLTASDVSAVPTSRTVNSKALSSNITLDKSDIGLGNVDNVKQMPIAGGTFTGKAYAQSNTDYTTAQIRNIVLSDSDPSGGNNGDIWIKYS